MTINLESLLGDEAAYFISIVFTLKCIKSTPKQSQIINEYRKSQYTLGKHCR
jgi:hypothetical protein